MEDVFRALVAAARRSSSAVLRVLDAAARAIEPSIDVTLFFVVENEHLLCKHSSGARAVVYRGTTLERIGESLPARAAAALHSISLAKAFEGIVPGDRCAVAVPVLCGRAVQGVWYGSGATVTRMPNARKIAALVACAGETYSLALERENDRNEATFDSLTGLLAPRAFRRRLHELVEESRDGILSLWFVDTDRFKRINDDYGHEAGDGVLRRMADLLRAHAVPERDVVGRKGGDEFCMLLRGSQKTQAIERARAFCAAVRACEFGVAQHPTASVGIASFPFDASDAASLLEAADAAMYHAKRSGRDRVAYAVEGAGFALYE